MTDKNILESSENPFPISRTAEENGDIYDMLADENGEVIRKPDDFAVRKGLTQKPLTTTDQHSITITHGPINGVGWFVKFLALYKSKTFKWAVPADRRGDHFRAEKGRILARIKDTTALTLEAAQGTGHTGTSTTGNSGRVFFSEVLKPVIDTIIPDKCKKCEAKEKEELKENPDKVFPKQCEHKQAIMFLHKAMSTVLRINAAKQKIDVREFQLLTVDIASKISKYFPWARLNFTLHQSIQHSAELITLNGGHGLGDLSEEGLEANNKDSRKFMDRFSRKYNPEKQLFDVMHRTLERSHPSIRHIIDSFHPQPTCSDCGIVGHTMRSHSSSRGYGPQMEYDSHVSDYLLK